jgi:hypothetical protein
VEHQDGDFTNDFVRGSFRYYISGGTFIQLQLSAHSGAAYILSTVTASNGTWL